MLVRISALLCIVLLVGCGGAAPERQTEYREAVQSDAVSFHPYLTTDSASSGYQGMVYASGFMRRDENTLELIPNMATGWDISGDGLTYVFTLRDDMVWTDGQPLTAYDFEWTFTQIMNPENEWPYGGDKDFIASYVATGLYELTITITEPFCPALEGVDFVTPLPSHVWKDFDWKDPATNLAIHNPTVTSGPYRLVEWIRDDHVIFVANDTYFKGRPKIDRYLIRVIPEQSVAFIMLESGEVDQATVLPAQYEDAKKAKNLTMYDWWLARGSWSYIGYNLRQPYLQDAEVRYAINYAIPKELIVEKIMAGLARRLTSTLVPDSPYYNPNVPWFKYDPDKANDLLANYPLGEDGLRAGLPRLNIVYGPHNNKIRQQLAVITQSYLRAVGIDSEIQSYEWGAYLEYLKKSTDDWDLCILGWRATIDPHWMRLVWTADTTLNHVGYNNPTVEAMFTDASHDCEGRGEIYNDLQYILAEECPYIFLFQNKSYAAVNNRVKGIVPTTLGVGYNMHEWWIEE